MSDLGNAMASYGRYHEGPVPSKEEILAAEKGLEEFISSPSQPLWAVESLSNFEWAPETVPAASAADIGYVIYCEDGSELPVITVNEAEMVVYCS